MADLIPIVLAIDNDAYRTAVEAVLREAGITHYRVCKSHQVVGMTPYEYAHALVLLETNDDVAFLVQVVNDLYYSPYHPGGSVSAICICSEAAWEYGKRLGFWLIQGGAAVFAAWSRSDDDTKNRAELRRDLLSVIHYLSREATSEDEAQTRPPRPTYAALVNAVLDDPQDADAVSALAHRLAEWQDDHFMNRELRTALARHVVRLQPGVAQSHLFLGKTLSIHHQAEEAEAELREAIRLDPNNAEVYKELGSLLADAKPLEAMTALGTAIRLDLTGVVAQRARNIIKAMRLRKGNEETP